MPVRYNAVVAEIFFFWYSHIWCNNALTTGAHSGGAKPAGALSITNKFTEDKPDSTLLR
jgi:hypothetical protein